MGKRSFRCPEALTELSHNAASWAKGAPDVQRHSRSRHIIQLHGQKELQMSRGTHGVVT
ncbi:hypothetical protein DPMN_048287 [Dreissena polymorpha]|uniref:Uncharacterized protein n=1 Tax=Dreissena polymorpha TaxID=45954 RepID=A0A9D4I2R1_DREPO|nr:hypothetical protein DPMN_048287 [Dreissena polymorpha]